MHDTFNVGKMGQYHQRAQTEYRCSSIGRVMVSKTIGCTFESYHLCLGYGSWAGRICGGLQNRLNWFNSNTSLRMKQKLIWGLQFNDQNGRLWLFRSRFDSYLSPYKIENLDVLYIAQLQKCMVCSDALNCRIQGGNVTLNMTFS